MSIPSIYINLEDDITQIVSRIKRERSEELVLVCPKRCFLFSDSINLRLLKKQVDLLDKVVYVLTMDERGQIYAKEAGFELKFLSKQSNKNVSDIRSQRILKPTNFKQKEVENELPEKEILEKKSVFTNQVDLKKTNSFALENFETADTSPKVTVTDRIFPKSSEEESAEEVKKPESVKVKFSGKFTFGFLFLTLAILVVVFVYVLPTATVTIFPKVETINRDLEISLSTSVKEPDANRLLLPVTRISETLEVENKFQSQGKKDVGNKAVGTVRIYNFTKLPINLKAQTTVFSVGNKSYVLTQDALGIKPTVLKNVKTNEIDENSLSPEVEVTAVEGGESYNLPAGVRMEVSNKVFGSKPKLLYAKSETAISGATTRYLSLVSEQDIAKSKEDLLGQLVENLKQDLNSKGLVLPEKGFKVEVVKFSSDKQSGEESPSFSAKLRATVSGLVFAKEDLRKIILERLSQAFGSGKNIQTSSDAEKLIFNLKAPFENVEQNNVLNVHYENNLVYEVKTEGLAEDLKGKNQNVVEDVLKRHSEIQRIDINLAPSWQKNFPIFAKKIHFSVQN